MNITTIFSTIGAQDKKEKSLMRLKMDGEKIKG